MPTSLNWRSTTTVAVFDPDHPDNPTGGTSPFNDAAVVAYGNAFGDPTMGLVMYEGDTRWPGPPPPTSRPSVPSSTSSPRHHQGPAARGHHSDHCGGADRDHHGHHLGRLGVVQLSVGQPNGGVFSKPAGTWNVGDRPSPPST